MEVGNLGAQTLMMPGPTTYKAAEKLRRGILDPVVCRDIIPMLGLLSALGSGKKIIVCPVGRRRCASALLSASSL